MFSFNFYDDAVVEKAVQNKVEEGDVRVISLEEILGQLPDTLAYSVLAGLPRRELWHVKMQLMQGDQNAELLGQSDVIKGLYEGGLKTWECSIDLAQYLSHQTYPHDLSVLEVNWTMSTILRPARLWFCITDVFIISKRFEREEALEICAARL